MDLFKNRHSAFETNFIGQINIVSISIVLLSLIAFLDSSISWVIYPAFKVLIYFLKFLCLILIPFLLIKNTKGNFLLFLLFIPLGKFVIDESSVSGIVQYLFSAIVPLCLFSLLEDEMKIKVVKGLIKIVYFFLLIAIPIYIVLQFTPLPHIVADRGSDGRSYFNYFFLYSSNGYGYITKRFTSIYEEPGSLASLLALLVFYNKSLFTKKQYWVFVICGVLTFSLFYMGLIIPLLYFSSLRTYSLPKKIYRIALFVLLIIISYFAINAFAKSTKGNGVYEVLFYNRFKWESGFIVGIDNNRDMGIPGFDEAFKKFSTKINTTEYWFGNGKNTVKETFGTSGLSYRVAHYESGMLIILYLFALLFFMHDWRKNTLFSVFSMVFLLAFFFQRPTLYLHTFIFIIYCGLVIIPKLEKANKSNLLVE